MTSFFVVVAHVVVLGQIATSNISADQADTQVQKIITQFRAFGASCGDARGDLLDELDV